MGEPQGGNMAESNGLSTKELLLRLESKMDTYIQNSQIQYQLLMSHVNELRAREPDKERRLAQVEVNMESIEKTLNAAVSDPEASPAGRVLSKEISDALTALSDLRKDHGALNTRVNQLFAGIAVLIFLANLLGPTLLRAVGTWLNL